eukprot:1181505-Prorocentrum_minimum.AAC.3
MHMRPILLSNGGNPPQMLKLFNNTAYCCEHSRAEACRSTHRITQLKIKVECSCFKNLENLVLLETQGRRARTPRGLLKDASSQSSRQELRTAAPHCSHKAQLLPADQHRKANLASHRS